MVSMKTIEDERRALALLADLVAYPETELAGKARDCAALLERISGEAAEGMARFGAFAATKSRGRMEEIYSAFFDLNPVCHPYIGYHLFGETYKRSEFLLGLKERYKRQGFEHDPRELPDRLSVMLTFLAQSDDRGLNGELVRDALLPALAKINKRESNDNADGGEETTSDLELEGHSQGEVLKGGFVLAQSEAPDTAPAESGAAHYGRMLAAAETLIKSLRFITSDAPHTVSARG